MNKNSFGNVLNKLLLISNTKKVCLAEYLSYDVSYISKWINGVNLPSSKNIDFICQQVSTYICDNISEDKIDPLISYLNIEYLNSYDTNFLSNYVCNTLKNAYNNDKSSYEKNKSTECSTGIQLLDRQSMLKVYPKSSLKHIMSILLEPESNINFLDAIFVVDLFNVNEKLSFLDQKKELGKAYSENQSNIKLLLSTRNLEDDITFNSLLLLHLVTTCPSLSFHMYITDAEIPYQVVAIKNTLVSISGALNSQSYLFTTVSTCQDNIIQIFDDYDNFIIEKSKPIFKKYTPEEILSNNTFNNHILASGIRWIIGNLNELFLEPALFLDISNNIFDKTHHPSLEKANVILNNITYKSKLQVILRKVDLLNFVSNGVIHFFNKVVVLTPDQRMKQLLYMAELLETNACIDVKMIEHCLSDGFSNEKNLSLYISNGSVFTKVHPENKYNDFIITKDSSVSKLLQNMFDKTWNDPLVNSSKVEIINFLRNLSSCSKIISI